MGLRHLNHETADRWQHVDALFCELLDAPPEERTALLAHRCGDDDALRQELDALLQAHRAAESYLDIRPDWFDAVKLPPQRRAGGLMTLLRRTTPQQEREGEGPAAP